MFINLSVYSGFVTSENIILACVYNVKICFNIQQSQKCSLYFLQTHEVDLKSNLGMQLKGKMLLALARKSFHPDDPEKQAKIFKKYRKYIIPVC